MNERTTEMNDEFERSYDSNLLEDNDQLVAVIWEGFRGWKSEKFVAKSTLKVSGEREKERKTNERQVRKCGFKQGNESACT